MAFLETALGIAKIGSAIAGGLGALRKERQRPAVDLANLRAQAKANGFNPLTVLRATGGAGFREGPAPVPLTVFGQTLAATADAIGAYTDNIQREEMHDAQLSLINTQTGVMKDQNTRAWAAHRLSMIPKPPKAGKTEKSPWDGVGWNDIPMVNVWSAAGEQFQIKANLADRLSIGEGDIWLTEDSEALWGEIGGEVYGVGSTGDFYWNQMFGDDVDPVIGGMPEQLREKTDEKSTVQGLGARRAKPHLYTN